MPAEDLYTVTELAAKWRVSRNLIYGEIRDGNLQHTRVGRGRNGTRIPGSIADAYWRERLANAKKTPLRAVA